MNRLLYKQRANIRKYFRKKDDLETQRIRLITERNRIIGDDKKNRAKRADLTQQIDDLLIEIRNLTAGKAQVRA